MARPSVKTEREAEILDAFETCVVKYGVEGATLQRIADEAGLARPLLRHYVGNREDLVEALAKRYIDQSNELLEKMLEWLPGQSRAETIVDVFFDRQYASSASDSLVAQALAVAAQTRPPLQAQLQQWFMDFEQVLIKEISTDFPAARQDEVEVVATGIIGIYFTADSVASIAELQHIHTRCKQAALRLLRTLAVK